MRKANRWDKPQEGEGQFAMSVNLLIPCENISSAVTWKNCSVGQTYNGIVALCRQDKNTDSSHPCNPKDDNRYYAWNLDDRHDVNVMEYSQSKRVFTGSVLNSKDIKPGTYQAYYVNYLKPKTNKRPTAQETVAIPVEGVAFSIIKMGGVYTLTISTDSDGKNNLMNIHTIVLDNHLNILWQIPQYVVITAAEILFSITGLEFAYSEASPELKSVVQAIWLFTVAIGDLIIILIAEANLFQNLATEMFVFAGAMVVVIGIFILLSIFYYEYAKFNSGSLEYELSDNKSLSCQSTIAMNDADSFSNIEL